PSVIAAASFLAAGLTPDPTVRFAGLALAVIGVSCAAPMMWAFPTRFLSGAAAAGGIALINSVGNLAGYVGPSLIGFLQEAAGVREGGGGGVGRGPARARASGALRGAPGARAAPPARRDSLTVALFAQRV